jgi:RNA polymerase subunit RPABC4/transcription elongation factor Spt4
LNDDRNINETKYTNNVVNITIRILNSDLEVKSTDIALANSNGDPYDLDRLLYKQDKIEVGQTVKINAMVYNHGDTKVTVKVGFYASNPVTKSGAKSTDARILGVLTRVIDAGDSQLVVFDWEVVDKGPFKIYVWADPDDEIIESKEGNNYGNMAETYEAFGASEKEDEEGIDMFMLMSIILIIIIVIVIIVVIYFMVIVKKRKDTMAECSECGNLMPLDATICNRCGAEFTDEVECGECGAIMSVTDNMCPECGAEFKKALSEDEVKGGENVPPKVGQVPVAKVGAPGAPKPPAPAPKIKKDEAEPAPAAPTPKVSAASADDEEMIECYQCGATVPLSAPMCPECGAEFE